MAQPRSNSDRFDIASPASPGELRVVDVAALSRYDLLLATVPLVLLLAWLVGRATSVPVWAALGVGALLALPLLGDGLAVNPPS